MTMVSNVLAVLVVTDDKLILMLVLLISLIFLALGLKWYDKTNKKLLNKQMAK